VSITERPSELEAVNEIGERACGAACSATGMSRDIMLVIGIGGMAATGLFLRLLD